MSNTYEPVQATGGSLARVIGREVFHVRITAPRACFTRPEHRVERFSSVVGSAGAWEGILSQVMGHRGVRYEIERVALLFRPRWLTMASNEQKEFDPCVPVDGKHRTLRTTVKLAGEPRTVVVTDFFGNKVKRHDAGVDYLLSFRVSAPSPKELGILTNMLLRRLKNGGHYRQAYLGIRDCSNVNIERVKSFADLDYPEGVPLVEHEDGLRAVDYSADLGISFYGEDYDDQPAKPYYFAPLSVVRGVVRYPTWQEVRSLGIRRRGGRC